MKVFIVGLLALSAVLAVPVEEGVGEFGDKIEGDILMTDEQKSDYFGRTGVINTRYRWTNNIVPYLLVGTSTAQAAYIRSALADMASKLCVSFVERTTEANYIRVTVSDSGCFSYIGMVGGAQQLNLQSYEPGTGCFRFGTIQHEFIHALGFYHMQSATERDDYVTIVFANIQPGTENNFAIQSASSVNQFGVPYDYGSVMHYPEVAFSVNGLPTIIPKDPNASIGQRDGMSNYDIQRINGMYC